MPVSVRRAALAVAIVFPALLVFSIRGPNRALTDSSDFATVYAASRCWMFHENPYLHSNVIGQYSLGHGDAEHTPNRYNGTSVYPPSIFPLVAAVAWLDWNQARRLWLAVNLLCFAASLVCLLRSELIPNAKVRTVLIVLFLLFSPVQSGIAKGQPSVACISLLVCAFYLRRSRKEEILSGLLLGLSCCIKPNIALPYILFCCWRRQWRVVAMSVAVTSLFSIAALTSLYAFSPGWLQVWSSNVRGASASGGSMDPTIAGISYLLVNFQTIVGFFTVNQALCNAVTYALLGGLAVWAIAVAKPLTDEWRLLALLSLLVLMGSYHRYYDLQLLMLGTNAVLEICRKQWQPRLWATLVVPGVLLWAPLQALAGDHIVPRIAGTPASLSLMAVQFFAFRNQPICLSVLTATFAWLVLATRDLPSRQTPLRGRSWLLTRPSGDGIKRKARGRNA